MCVIGSGGREHALAAALSRTADVVVTPGNPGMRLLSGLACAPGPAESIPADLYVIGPEAPLVDGLADRLRAAGKLVFGPGADGAQLEGSKAWMKAVLASAGVPSARYGTFAEVGPAVEYLRSLPGPWVVKTDGLAAGKGVLVTDDVEAAAADVAAKLSGRAFGDAGRRVVIEEGLTGPEVSIMAVCDGAKAVALAPAQDFKRVGDGDVGANTGGMGAYSWVPGVGDDIVAEVVALAIEPTLAELARRGIDYRGVLYAGLMLTAEGPRVLEFNVRFGDPETQVVAPRWEGDVAEVLAAAAAGDLDAVAPPRFSATAAVCVVIAAPGYPDAPRLGGTISGLESAQAQRDVQLYAAGVANAISDGPDPSGLVTAGGRVLGVTGLGPSVGEARQRAYGAVEQIHWPGALVRHDIAALAAKEDRK